jgi:hypothetical protein
MGSSSLNNVTENIMAETKKHVPGKLTITITIQATDKDFEVDIDLGRELEADEGCEIAALLNDDEKVLEELSNTEFIQALAHVLGHELEDAREAAKNLPN